MRRKVRYSVEWPGHDAPLGLVEPTLAEVKRYAPDLAGYYNEPVNRALLTNDHEFAPADVVDQFETMWEDGDRPFLLFEGSALVGDCDLRNLEADRAEFAILVGPRATQGRGKGTRFTTMALALAFGPLAMARVYASIRPENAGSLRMFAKVGFAVDVSPEARRYAEAPDDVCVSLGAPEFAAAHAVDLAALQIKTR